MSSGSLGVKGTSLRAKYCFFFSVCCTFYTDVHGQPGGLLLSVELHHAVSELRHDIPSPRRFGWHCRSHPAPTPERNRPVVGIGYIHRRIRCGTGDVVGATQAVKGTRPPCEYCFFPQRAVHSTQMSMASLAGCRCRCR